MHSVEKEILNNSKLKPRIWRHFFDGVFIIWTHRKEKLEEFLNYINGVHETIKFTAEYSTTDVAFLDTLVYKLNGKLASKVYHKKTDDKMYLHYSSDPTFILSWYIKKSHFKPPYLSTLQIHTP